MNHGLKFTGEYSYSLIFKINSFFESYNGVYLTLNVNIIFFDSDIGKRGLTRMIIWLLK